MASYERRKGLSLSCDSQMCSLSHEPSTGGLRSRNCIWIWICTKFQIRELATPERSHDDAFATVTLISRVPFVREPAVAN